MGKEERDTYNATEGMKHGCRRESVDRLTRIFFMINVVVVVVVVTNAFRRDSQYQGGFIHNSRVDI